MTTGGLFWGLSPRLRGNRMRLQYGTLDHRSIPAPTGEPVRACHQVVDLGVYPRAYGEPRGRMPGWSITTVYPRAYGGTGSTLPQCLSLIGLSPRLRGNRARPAVPPGIHRSIPAPTGEPPVGHVCAEQQGVYPRAYGGTPHPGRCSGRGRGLSPRLRGNRLPLYPQAKRGRSIPAPTGEPT